MIYFMCFILFTRREKKIKIQNQSAYAVFIHALSKLFLEIYVHDLNENQNKPSQQMRNILSFCENTNIIRHNKRSLLRNKLNADPHQLNELFYYDYLAWADNDVNKNSPDGLKKWLENTYFECRFLHDTGVISSSELSKFISSLKRLQLNSVFEQCSIKNRPYNDQIILSSLLVDHHRSRPSKTLTKTSKSIQKIMSTFIARGDKNQKERIAKIFSSEKPGTIAKIVQKLSFEREYSINADLFAGMEFDALKSIFKNCLKTSVNSIKNSRGLNKAQKCTETLNKLYQYVVDCHYNKKISIATQNKAIVALKSLQIDLAYTLRIEMNYLSQPDKNKLLSGLEKSPLAKHHRSSGIKWIMSNSRTQTQEEIHMMRFENYYDKKDKLDFVFSHTSDFANITLSF